MSARQRARSNGRKRGSATSTGRKRCLVDGGKLRLLREDAELSIRALAYSVGVDPKTITDLEAGGRRTWTQVRVVKSIAAHPEINVDWAELLVEESRPGNARDELAVAHVLPARSSLDAFIAEERRVGKPAPLESSQGAVPCFGAAELAKVFSSPGSQAGKRYYVQGRVHAHRGLSVSDGLVLGTRYQDGSRFEIARGVGELPKPLSIMAITTMLDHTRHCQDAWEEEREVVVVVRVVVADLVTADADHVLVTNLDGGADHLRPRRSGEEMWTGFMPIYVRSDADAGSAPRPRPHPWALVVESVQPDKAGAK